MRENRFLMCAPRYFNVEYIINPWMEGQVNNADSSLAAAQWQDFHSVLSRYAEIALLPSQPGLPDLVFTANAAIVQNKTAILSRFNHPERQGEEPFYQRWLEQDGFEVEVLPDDLAFEGAGDALFDREAAVLWFGHGHRSSPRAAPRLEAAFGMEVVSLQLTDPRFYHLDTCFCPLEGGYLIWNPGAFDAAAVANVKSRVAPEKRLAVSETDALDFACNAVNAGRAVILNRATAGLRDWLEVRGFEVLETPTSEFLRAGGSTKCLTLRLDEAAQTQLVSR
ncbi:MAG: nitrate reductase [Pleurocapsa sp. SU_196_0]|nr:nitrate reductase [Pleurocapsa sp. SU_196_0]